MPRSTVDVVRELGYRWADMVLSEPTAPGGTTTLIDEALDGTFPDTTSGINVFVYGGLDVPALNVGIERRARSWAQPSHTLTFYTAWPAVIAAQGTYEVYRRAPRSRLVSAINAGLGQLGAYWYRPFIDNSIVTAEGQYRYVLPTGQNWITVNRIEIEWPSTPSLIGYPYEELRGWGVEEDQTGGGRTLYLQLSHLLPEGRRLRIHGEGYFSEIEVDTDTIDCVGPLERVAMEWIWDYAEFKLNSWNLNSSSTLDQEKASSMRQNKLLDTLEDIKKRLPGPKNVRVLTPLSGDGRLRFGGNRRDPTLIGAAWSQANH